MIDRRNWLPFLAGLAAATALALSVGPRQAAAQARIDTTIAPPPQPQAVQQRDPRARTQPGTAIRPTVLDEPGGQARGDRSRTPAAGNADEEESEEAQSAGDGAPAASAASRTRPATVDGDFADPVTIGPVDGTSLTGEPAGPADGVDPASNDQRPPEDAAAFAIGADAFDPDAFSLEVAPVLDRRPANLARFEPYTPTGIRVGSFVVLPQLEVGSLFSSNLLRTSTRPQSDIAGTVLPEVRIVSNWRRHAIELRGRGTLSAFADLASENDRAYTLEARGRYDISRRISIEALTSRDVAQESRSSVDALQGLGQRTTVTTDTLAATYNQRFNRLSLQLRGSVIEQRYDNPDQSGAGTFAAVGNRDVRTTEEAARTTWEFKPTLLAFSEIAINQRDYAAVSSSDGILRNSAGERYRLGIGFGSTSQTLRGEIALGYGRQRPDDRRLVEIDGFLVDATVAFRMSAFTSLLATARTDFTETTLASSPGALSRSFTGELRHTLRRNLIATGTIAVSLLDYRGVSLSERETTTGLGLEYFADRDLVLFGGWRHIALDSSDAARNFNTDEVRLGVRVRR